MASHSRRPGAGTNFGCSQSLRSSRRSGFFHLTGINPSKEKLSRSFKMAPMTNTNDPASHMPSNQRFGWVFSAMCTALGIYLQWKFANYLTLVFFVLSVFFAASASFAPQLLQPLNKAWYQLGIFFGRFVSPIVLGVLFFLLITPIAISTRLAGRDPLRMKKRNLTSHWLDRQPVGPTPDSFKNQF